MSRPGDDSAVVTLAELTQLKARLARARSALVARPVAEIADVLGRVGERFGDPDDLVRQFRCFEAQIQHPAIQSVFPGMRQRNDPHPVGYETM